MAGGGIEVSVRTDFFEKLQAMVTRVNKGTVAAVDREAETEMTMSKRLVPVATGALRASGRVEGPEYEGLHGVKFRLAYGGSALGYALRVHEDLNMHHSNGQAKFLEGPVREEVGSGRAERRIMADLNEQGIQ
jgi:hypothetical protein